MKNKHYNQQATISLQKKLNTYTAKVNPVD